MKRFWLAPAMLAAAVLYAGIDPSSGLRTWWQLRAELAESRAQAAATQREIEALEEASAELRGDAFAMEKAIREDLGLARAGETLVLFADPEASSARNP